MNALQRISVLNKSEEELLWKAGNVLAMNVFINMYRRIKKEVVIFILTSGIRDTAIENAEMSKTVEELLKRGSI